MLRDDVCNWCGEHKDERERRPYLYGIRLCSDCLEAHAAEWHGMPDMVHALLVKNREIEE